MPCGVGILVDRSLLLVLAIHGAMTGAERGEVDLDELRVIHNLAVELRDGLSALAPASAPDRRPLTFLHEAAGGVAVGGAVGGGTDAS